MRVVLAASITSSGGVWRHVVDLAGGLESRGCTVSLALPDEATVLRGAASDRGIACRSFGDGGGADVWHVHVADTFDPQVLRALVGARRRAGAVLVTEHLPRTDASDPSASPQGASRSFGAWSVKTAFKRVEYLLADRIICVSQASGRFLQLRYGVAGTSIAVIPNGIARRGRPVRPPSDDPCFVAVGSVINQKGFDLLIDAAAHAKEPWRVVVLGEGPHREALTDLAGTLGAPVEFAGWSEHVPAALGRSRGLVLPSRWESWPYVAMEAMALGRPVVAAAVDGVPELVVHGETGILVPPGDPEALARALDLLASDTDLATGLGEAGRIRVGMFDLDGMVDAHLAAYRGAMAGRRRGRAGPVAA